MRHVRCADYINPVWAVACFDSLSPLKNITKGLLFSNLNNPRSVPALVDIPKAMVRQNQLIIRMTGNSVTQSFVARADDLLVCC